MKKIFTEEDFLLLKLENKFKDDYQILKYVTNEYILSEEFIIKFLGKSEMKAIIRHQKLSEEFIRKYLKSFDDMDLRLIIDYQDLNINLVKKILASTRSFFCYVYAIEKYKFSEKYIYEYLLFADPGLKRIISAYQKLSYSFINSNWGIFKNYRSLIINNQYISERTKKKVLQKGI